ncbi:hypothetical protein BRCON_2038 [Candidatus Sumerlaea chitinivorans]|uniref:Uncharacterized protein n=1 Tax=Sumerlaea chitinivorans TaxID=2250252 RepID=A0A2Z4Y8Q6_SUMC1|nr:hypothetical protein BRCON_2038 [Candidatus Sumerlaea chitinivorans]
MAGGGVSPGGRLHRFGASPSPQPPSPTITNATTTPILPRFRSLLIFLSLDLNLSTNRPLGPSNQSCKERRRWFALAQAVLARLSAIFAANEPSKQNSARCFRYHTAVILPENSGPLRSPFLKAHDAGFVLRSVGGLRDREFGQMLADGFQHTQFHESLKGFPRCGGQKGPEECRELSSYRVRFFLGWKERRFPKRLQGSRKTSCLFHYPQKMFRCSIFALLTFHSSVFSFVLFAFCFRTASVRESCGSRATGTIASRDPACRDRARRPRFGQLEEWLLGLAFPRLPFSPAATDLQRLVHHVQNPVGGPRRD